MTMDDRQDSKSPKASAVLTGARSDDSSLFSLDKLRQAEESAAQSSHERDESGLIDLQALAALSGSARSRSADSPLLVSASASLFAVPTSSVPLESPLSAIEASSPAELPSKRRTMFVVLGGAVAVAVAAVAFLSMQVSGTPPAATTALMAPALTAPAPPPAAVAAPAPEVPQMAAVVPGQRAPAVEPPKAAAAAPIAKPAAAVARAASPATPRAPAAAVAPKEPAKPAAPACDLTCQMQKAVSKTK